MQGAGGGDMAARGSADSDSGASRLAERPDDDGRARPTRDRPDRSRAQQPAKAPGVIRVAPADAAPVWPLSQGSERSISAGRSGTPSCVLMSPSSRPLNKPRKEARALPPT